MSIYFDIQYIFANVLKLYTFLEKQGFVSPFSSQYLKRIFIFKRFWKKITTEVTVQISVRFSVSNS